VANRRAHVAHLAVASFAQADQQPARFAPLPGGARPELHDWMRRLFHERTTQKLSVQALETLAVIAYRQPVTAVEVMEIRGVNTSGVLSTLLERNLIRMTGRKNVVGRPLLYGTTREFLIRFGLKDLADLPSFEDMTQALGFDPPALRVEKPVAKDMLLLDAADEAAGIGVEPADAVGSGDAVKRQTEMTPSGTTTP
jgi:segregation and condensation protein B